LVRCSFAQIIRDYHSHKPVFYESVPADPADKKVSSLPSTSLAWDKGFLGRLIADDDPGAAGEYLSYLLRSNGLGGLDIYRFRVAGPLPDPDGSSGDLDSWGHA